MPCERYRVRLRDNLGMYQLCDDIFVAYVMQTDRDKCPYSAIEADLDFYQVRPPGSVRDFSAIFIWIGYFKHDNIRHVQRQAHHLALLLERGELDSTDLFDEEKNWNPADIVC